MKIKTMCLGMLLALGIAIATPFACAQGEFPSKPIRLVVGFAPGGSTDLLARALGQEARKLLGEEIVVVNKPGASGVIAINEVAAANPDGYTIGVSPSTAFTLAHHFMKIRPDLLEATGALLLVGRQRSGIVARGDSAQRSLKELVEYARTNPSKVSIGITGTGTTSELTTRSIAMQEKLDVNIVPFQGDAQVATALLGGHIAAATLSAGGWMSHVRSGTLRLLAAAAEERFDIAPDVPTLTEMGYSFSGTAIQHVYGPKGLPAQVARRLIGAFTEATRSPAFIEVASSNGLYTRNLIAGEALDRYLLKDRTGNAEQVEKLGLKNKP